MWFNLRIFCQLHAEALIYVSCRLQVGDVPHKRKKGVFGTKGGDKEVSFSTLRFLSKRLKASIQVLPALYCFFLFYNAQHVLCRAVGSKFLKIFVDGYYALGSVS